MISIAQLFDKYITARNPTFAEDILNKIVILTISSNFDAMMKYMKTNNILNEIEMVIYLRTILEEGNSILKNNVFKEIVELEPTFKEARPKRRLKEIFEQYAC